MSRRLKKILVRTSIVLLVLGVLGLTAFTYFLFWPLEGSVDDMALLVPADVDFVYKGSFRGLRESGWLQRNILDDPVVPQLRDNDSLQVAQDRIKSQIAEFEQQINSSIPLGLATFSFEDDVVRGDVIQAGRFCAGSDPDYGPPIINEWMLMTRVSWMGRFFSGVKNGFVRDAMKPGLTVEDLGDGIFKFTAHTFRPSPLRERALCAPGVVRPPENIFFIARHKDVLAFGNDEDLMREFIGLGNDPDAHRNYLERPWVTLDHGPNAVAASMDLHGLRRYLKRSIEVAGPPATILSHYLTIDALDRMNGRLVFASPDLVRGEAQIRYQPSLLRPGLSDVYALAPEALGESVAALVPAEDTFGALLLKTPPYHLINAIYREVLEEGDRQMWRDNLRRMGGYQDIDEFFREFAGKLSDTAGIAVARMSDPWDRIDYASFYDPVEDFPDPNFPAMAFIVQLNEGTTVAELDAYLKERVPLLGGSEKLEKKTYKGLEYTRIHLKVQAQDYYVMQPAYLLAQDHFVFSSNEGYFKKIVDTMVDPQTHLPLARDATFRAVFDQLPKQSHLAFFMDLEKLFTVPPSVSVGGMPRGFLWDRRAIWVRQNRDPREAAIQYRKELQAQHMKRTGRPPSAQREAEIERLVTTFADRWEQERFGEFLEEYRRELGGYGRLRAFGLGIRAERPSLFVKIPFFLRPSGDQDPGE